MLALTLLLPIAAFLIALPLLRWFFRATWQKLDQDAARQQAELLASGRPDYRAPIALVVGVLVLTLEYYYGGRIFFNHSVRPALARWDAARLLLQLDRYDELYGYAWWSISHIFAYVAIPLVVWKIAFPKDSFLDFGLRSRGLREHVWIYGVFVAITVPLLLLAVRQPDFAIYPYYRAASRSVWDLAVWETLYIAQFFALEFFFRGFWQGALEKSLGSTAIFVVAVPYCMVHFGKPYPEAAGSVLAGIALGSLSARTHSVYLGFLVHITIALTMDGVSLAHRHALPGTFWLP